MQDDVSQIVFQAEAAPFSVLDGPLAHPGVDAAHNPGTLAHFSLAAHLVPGCRNVLKAA
jgi:hypothetical protein